MVGLGNCVVSDILLFNAAASVTTEAEPRLAR